METLISTHDLTRKFGELVAVNAISIDVREGEMFGLVGPDGSGKTTLLRMLCGILTPSSGSATILGYNLLTQSEQVKKKIGYLSQRFSLYGDLTIDENIEFFAEINGVYDYKARRDELLNFTRLTPFRDRLADRLSGGMKQKLSLACTLVHTPTIIFLDEPTTGVDPVSRRDFWKILQSLVRQGISIIMSTPYLDEAERCSRVAMMNSGSIMSVDTPENLRNQMKGEVLEVVIDRVRDGFRLFQHESSIMEVQAFGDRLNIVVDHAGERWPELERLLTDSGIVVKSMRVVRPSLENVFISLLTHEQQNEAVA